MIKGYPDGAWDEMPSGYPDDSEGSRRAVVDRRVNMADRKIRLFLSDGRPGHLADALEFLALARKVLRLEP